MVDGLVARRVVLAAALVWCGTTCATDQPAERPFVEPQVAFASEGISQDEFGISQGTPDVANRYRSVVSIRNGKSTCSGVLAAPRLVLSAAHCFCLPHDKKRMIIDSSNCVKEVAVLSYFYRRVEGGWVPSKDVTGVTSPDGIDSGTRRFGRNIVTELRLADDRMGREIRFRFPGAHTHSGDSGGPCFREQGDERWLVGINGGYVSQGTTESWFTSTSSYREWIEKQIEAARKLEAP